MAKSLALALSAVLALVPAARAETPGKHPAYLHALTDLRHARWNLQHREAEGDMKVAIDGAVVEIDAAIGILKEAATEDGKDLDDPQPGDAALPVRGRLHHALDNLVAARADVAKEEDNEAARALKRRALEKIGAAERRTRVALCAAGEPAYCKA